MKIFLSIIIMMMSLVFAFAQEKIVDKSQFEEIRKNYIEILKTKPRRVTITSETSVNGEPQKHTLSKTVSEVSANRRRSVNEKTSDQKSSKNEYVQIGNKAYQRENNGDWKEAQVFDRNQMNRIKILSEESDFKTLGTEIINGQETTIYQRNSKIKKLDTLNNKEISSNELVKYWIDKSGALLKREENRENQVDGKTFNFNLVFTIEYLKDVQIEAPINK